MNINKVCPRCKKIRKMCDFLSFNKTRYVKSCIECREGSRASYLKNRKLIENQEIEQKKIKYKKRMKELNEELKETEKKLKQVKELERNYKITLKKIHRTHADHILNQQYIVIGDF